MSIRIRKTDNGKTVFDIRLQYDGIRISRTVRTTMTEAKRVEGKILHDLTQGNYEIFTNKQDPQFKDFADQYLKNVKWQKSYTRTETIVDNLKRFFGQKRLTEITESDFLNYRGVRLNTVSSATINRERSGLLRMLNVAVKDDAYKIRKNPISNVKPLKELPVENRVLTVEQYHQILDAAKPYFRKVIFFACNTGLRKMEILNLKFKQIRLSISSAEVELLDTKSGNREFVPLNNDMISLLEEIAAERKINLRDLKSTDREKYVFTGSREQRLKSIRKPMEYTFAKAEVELRPFHTFRHFWTKMMFDSGVDPYTIQKVGRWRDFETMLRYCYTTRPEEHEAVNKLAERLSRKRPNPIKMWQ